MTRLLLPALLLLALSACSSAPGAPPDAPEPPASSVPADAPAEVPTEAPAVAGPGGCQLVTADMISAAIGVDPGPCTAAPSNIAGPDTGEYEAIGADVQITSDASVYLTDAVCSTAALDGSLDVPGADRGYADLGSFCFVKGETGVMFTAFILNDSATASDYQALAIATLAKLS